MTGHFNTNYGIHVNVEDLGDCIIEWLPLCKLNEETIFSSFEILFFLVLLDNLREELGIIILRILDPQT